MRAPALRELQAGFWRSLHSGAPDAALVAAILPSATLTPAERVSIYQSMYVWRLHEVLGEDYPKTAEALGDGFESVVRRYLERHPSEHPSLRHLGRHLPAFLARDAATSERPWLAELARLELARTNAFDAPDAVPLRATDLHTIAPEAWASVRFVPIAAVEVVRSAWPVHEVWADPTATPSPRDTLVRVWRQEFRVFHAAIDALEASALERLVARAPFAAICDAVVEHVPPENAASSAGALLARWIEDGLLAAFES